MEEKLTNISPYKDVPWNKIIIICVGIVLFYWLIASSTTLWDRDEPRFSRATVEMIESGNYLYPTFNEKLRPDKPILVYWLMAIPIKLFGVHAFSCRFFSGIGTGLTCLFTYLIGFRLIGRRAGYWSIIILSTTLLMLVIGTFATSDAVMLPWMVGSMLIFVNCLLDKKFGIPSIILMGLAFGLALLAKGPVGLLPVPSMIVTLVILRKQDYNYLSFLGPILIALVIGIAIFLAWAIPANNATDGQFAKLGLGHHVLDRMRKPMEGHGGDSFLYFLLLPYYIGIIIAAFYPWTIHLLGAFKALFEKRIGGRIGYAVLVGWIFPTLIIMTLVSTKLAHYVLFIWPALALCVAGTIAIIFKGNLENANYVWLQRGWGFFGIINIGIVLAAIVGPWFLPDVGIGVKFMGLLAGAIVLFFGHFAIQFQVRSMPIECTHIVLYGILGFLFISIGSLLPALEKVKIPPKISQAVVESTSADVPVGTFEFGEPTMNFYIGRPITQYSGLEDAMAWLGREQEAVLILPQSYYQDWNDQHGQPKGVSVLKSVKGFNYSNGKPLEVLILHKRD